MTKIILYITIKKLFALHYILNQDARSTVQTEQTVPVGHVVGPRMWQQIVFDICGTVVCSADVFLYMSGEPIISDKVLIRENYGPYYGETGGIFYDNQNNETEENEANDGLKGK